jgi:hypothetical protein
MNGEEHESSTAESKETPLSAHQKELMPVYRWRERVITDCVMLLLSLVGVGITDWAPKNAWQYWSYLVPVFGIICIVEMWRARRPDERHIHMAMLRRQILHWLGLMACIYLVFTFVRMGRVSAENAGLVNLMMLALTMFLEGVHFDWMYLVVGLVLGVFAASAAYLEQYILFWMLPVAAAAAIIIAWRWKLYPMMQEKKRKKQEEEKEGQAGV